MIPKQYKYAKTYLWIGTQMKIRLVFDNCGYKSIEMIVTAMYVYFVAFHHFCHI